MGNVGQTAYAATKAALIGAAKSIAREYASRNMTANVVAPGFIDTDMTASMTAEQREQLMKVVPLGRTGEAGRRRAPRALYLASEEASYVTGPGPARERRHAHVASGAASRVAQRAWGPKHRYRLLQTTSSLCVICEPPFDQCEALLISKRAAPVRAPPPLDSRPIFRYRESCPHGHRHSLSEVKRIIKEQLDVDEKDIKPESTFIDDLGADSLGLVELVLAFEEAFEIDIPDEDTEKIRTVQDAVDYIERHAKK